MNIQQSTNKSIISEWKVYATATNLPREGHPSQLTDKSRPTTTRPMVTLIELGSLSVKMGASIYENNISCMELDSKNKADWLEFDEKHIGDCPNEKGAVVR